MNKSEGDFTENNSSPPGTSMIQVTGVHYLL